jgi:hypothetical protein
VDRRRGRRTEHADSGRRELVDHAAQWKEYAVAGRARRTLADRYADAGSDAGWATVSAALRVAIGTRAVNAIRFT